MTKAKKYEERIIELERKQKLTIDWMNEAYEMNKGIHINLFDLFVFFGFPAIMLFILLIAIIKYI